MHKAIRFDLKSHCPREYVQELRGDVGGSAIDTYYHIDKKKIIIFLEHLLGG